MESAPSVDHGKQLPKVEAEPKQPSQGETKAQELLSHIPGLNEARLNKLSQAFSDHLNTNFLDQKQRQMILDAKPTNREEAHTLWNIVKEGPRNDFAQKMMPFIVDRVKLEPLKQHRTEFTQEEVDSAIENLDKHLIERFDMGEKGIPNETQRKVIADSLKTWAPILRKIPDATVFASTAMYLWGATHEKG